MGLKRLVSGFRQRSGAQPPRPDRQTVLVGDIHGRADLLDRLLGRLRSELGDTLPVSDLVFLGDYVDRGPDSAAVLARLREMESGSLGRVVCLRGNHEQMLLDFLGGDPQAMRLCLRNGGLQTLASFGISAPQYDHDDAGMESLRRDAELAIPREVIMWLHALPHVWRSGDVVGVHAALRPSHAPQDEDEATLIWGRPDLMRTPRDDGLWVVHGHTVTRPAEIDGRRIAIDTGAWFSETLTAVVLVPDTAPRFIDTA